MSRRIARYGRVRIAPAVDAGEEEKMDDDLAADADRERVANALQAAYADGRLTKEELDRRIRQAAGVAEYRRLRTRRRIGRPPAPRLRPGDDYAEILEHAVAYAREQFPHVSPQLRAAFANSVAYAVTGMSGGYGGPSVREHAACRSLAGRRLGFGDAIAEFASPDGPVFGPLTSRHRQGWEEEQCFDDDPADAEALTSWR